MRKPRIGRVCVSSDPTSSGKIFPQTTGSTFTLPPPPRPALTLAESADCAVDDGDHLNRFAHFAPPETPDEAAGRQSLGRGRRSIASAPQVARTSSG